MATYYARNVTGNWNVNTSWDSASSGGAGPAGPPAYGDDVIFDSGYTGTITVTANAVAQSITVQAGATGTLHINDTFGVGINGGGTKFVTLASGFTFSATGTGKLTVSTALTITSGGVSIPNFYCTTGITVTLADAFTVAGAIELFPTTAFAFAGAYDISCATLRCHGAYATASSVSLVAGRTLTVSTAMRIVGLFHGDAFTIQSATNSSDTYLHYNGAVADCKVFGAKFTDINCAHAIDNWYGGTLTRTTGITNRTSADIGATDAEVATAVWAYASRTLTA